MAGDIVGNGEERGGLLDSTALTDWDALETEAQMLAGDIKKKSNESKKPGKKPPAGGRAPAAARPGQVQPGGQHQPAPDGRVLGREQEAGRKGPLGLQPGALSAHQGAQAAEDEGCQIFCLS